MKRWSVRKEEDGRWCVLDRDCRYDIYDTLEEAHTYATQLAVADVLFEPGGLTCLKRLQTAYNTLLAAVHLPPVMAYILDGVEVD